MFIGCERRGMGGRGRTDDAPQQLLVAGLGLDALEEIEAVEHPVAEPGAANGGRGAGREREQGRGRGCRWSITTRRPASDSGYTCDHRIYI